MTLFFWPNWPGQSESNLSLALSISRSSLMWPLEKGFRGLNCGSSWKRWAQERGYNTFSWTRFLLLLLNQAMTTELSNLRDYARSKRFPNEWIPAYCLRIVLNYPPHDVKAQVHPCVSHVARVLHWRAPGGTLYSTSSCARLFCSLAHVSKGYTLILPNCASFKISTRPRA